MLIIYFYLFSIYTLFFQSVSSQKNIRWCTVSDPEQQKCLSLSSDLSTKSQINSLYNLTCVREISSFNCMQSISKSESDLATFDVGLGWYASQYYSLRPLAMENYGSGNTVDKRDLNYFASIVVPASKSDITPFDFRGAEICFAGAGMAEGWVMQLAKLIGDLKAITVTQCNSIVQNLEGFLGDSCIPGALNELFNRFGDNSEVICRLCHDKGFENYCTFSDKYAGNIGALKCLDDHNKNVESSYKPVAAFVRSREIEIAALDGFPVNDYLLLCPNKQASGLYTTTIDNWASCNWGEIPARMIMANMNSLEIKTFRDFIDAIVQAYPVGNDPLTGLQPAGFSPWSSQGYNSTNNQATHNLMFSDFTRTLYLPPDADTISYYHYLDKTSNYIFEMNKLNECPLPPQRFCVIDNWEMEKCQKMRNAFGVIGIQPDLECILGNTTGECMKLIRDGYADMISLDAGDLYSAGKYMNLVPIVSEQYGEGPFFYAVGVVRKINPNMLISNWKFKRTCHSGVGKSTGWFIPLNIILDTVQVQVRDNQLVYALGELVSQSCIPGVLDSNYNTNSLNSLNLCEACVGGNSDKCERDNTELYYGHNGAFRCLVETGDIAFTKHTTVHANTGGRNPNYWARNQREDDFELLCSDGRRTDTNRWRECNLGKVPSNVIVTGSYKSENERMNMWRIFQYGQEFYSGDKNNVFKMFDSGFYHSDLIFSDDTESLQLIPWENQEYTKWLGPEFIRLVENIEKMSGDNPNGIFNSCLKMKRIPAAIFVIMIIVTI